MSAKRHISLPEELCASAEQRYGAQFQSLELFLEFVLRELVRDDVQKLDEKERAMLEERLRNLGYI
jgi:hypothetical protein